MANAGAPMNLTMLGFIAVTVVCWGVYGPLLNWGQIGFEGSRLRAFLMVGVAYLLVAVIAPLVILQFTDDSRVKEGSRYRPAGITWSLIAGTAGAIGALGIILAYNNGGTPVTVMPIVFGFAPVVATLFTIATSKLWDKVSLPFFLGIGLIIVGMIVVLKTAPHPSPPKKKPADAQETAAVAAPANSPSSTDAR